MRVFLLNQNNPFAVSLVEKLNHSQHGQLILVTPEEWKFVKGGGLLPIDLPEAPIGKLTTSPLPPGTSPKPPVA